MLKVETKKPVFTGHNIKLSGKYTMPEMQPLEKSERIVHLKSVLEKNFPDKKERIADIGCFEGGISLEIALMGYETLGIEARQSNIDCCNYVKSKTKLSNLNFVKDVAINLPSYGKFDAIVCYGLLYHLDAPKKFLKMITPITSMLLLDTHFSLEEEVATGFQLSELKTNEGLRGRWFREFPPETSYLRREEMRASSWDNHQSFWVLKEELVQMLNNLGFNVEERIYDKKSLLRGIFVAVKNPQHSS